MKNPSLALSATIAFLVGLVAGAAYGLEPWRATPANASHCGLAAPGVYHHTQQRSVVAAYGIDGYVSASGTLADPQCNKIVRLLNVSPDAQNPTTWVQNRVRIGYQASNPHVYDSTNKVYIKSLGNCFAYSRTVFGSPLSTNQAYYISYTPSQNLYSCSSNQYAYALHRDDWYNPPLSYKYLRVASPEWLASVEVGTLKSPNVWVWLGPVYFGSPSSDLSHGLAWYNQPLGT